MIINETYVNDSVIARMNFVPQKEWCGDTEIHKTNSYADILTVQGSQIQVICTKEQYMVGLNSLSMDSFVQELQCKNCKKKCPIEDRVTFPICVPSTLEQARQVKEIILSYHNYQEDKFSREISSFFDTLCCEIRDQEEI